MAPAEDPAPPEPAKQADLTLYPAGIEVTVQLTMLTDVYAQSQADAELILDAFVNDKRLPDGIEGHFAFNAADFSWIAVQKLADADGDFDKAGWSLKITHPPMEGDKAEMMRAVLERRPRERLASHLKMAARR